MKNIFGFNGVLRRLGLIFSAFAAIPCSAQAAADDSLVFIHANVIDGISNAPTMDATVVVAKGRIESIGHGAAPAGRGAVVDLTGHWLLPGFVDAHVHVGNLADAKRALRSGATTIGEAGVNHFADIGMRELNHKGVVDVPDVVAAGYHIRTHPADDYFIDFPQDIRFDGRRARDGSRAADGAANGEPRRGPDQSDGDGAGGNAGHRSAHPRFQ